MIVRSMPISCAIGALAKTTAMGGAVIGPQFYQHTIVSLKRNGRYMYSKLTGPQG